MDCLRTRVSRVINTRICALCGNPFDPTDLGPATVSPINNVTDYFAMRTTYDRLWII